MSRGSRGSGTSVGCGRAEHLTRSGDREPPSCPGEDRQVGRACAHTSVRSCASVRTRVCVRVCTCVCEPEEEYFV